MKRLLAFLLALGSSALANRAEACLVAHQVRFVVVGGAADSVIALELEQVRDGDLETGKEWFFVTPRLVAVEMGRSGTADARRVLEAWPEQRLETSQAQAWLEKTYGVALARAKQQQGFVPAVVESRTRCNYLERCGAYQSVTAGLRGPGERTFALTTPRLLDEASGGPTTDFHGAGIDTVDLVTAGRHRLAVVTMGYGWDQDPCEHAAGPCVDDRKPETVAPPSTVRAGLAHRRGLHHGREWDVIVTR